MLVQRPNAGRIFVQTFVEFRRPRCSGGGLGQASVVDNGRAIHTSDLLNKQKMSFTEVQGDLFTSSDSLVHCVSRDLHMGKGIATEFKKQFGGVSELREQNVDIGEVGVLHRGDRYIYYLVTKDRYFHKPKLDDLCSSLKYALTHCQNHGVTRLAMPRIGCGLDKLNWADVSQALKEIFVKNGISVTVFTV